MDQDPIQTKTRHLAALQIGDQVLQMCELHARLEQAQAEIAALKQQLSEALKPHGDVPDPQ